MQLSLRCLSLRFQLSHQYNWGECNFLFWCSSNWNTFEGFILNFFYLETYKTPVRPKLSAWLDNTENVFWDFDVLTLWGESVIVTSTWVAQLTFILKKQSKALNVPLLLRCRLLHYDKGVSPINLEYTWILQSESLIQGTPTFYFRSHFCVYILKNDYGIWDFV